MTRAKKYGWGYEPKKGDFVVVKWADIAGKSGWSEEKTTAELTDVNYKTAGYFVGYSSVDRQVSPGAWKTKEVLLLACTLHEKNMSDYGDVQSFLCGVIFDIVKAMEGTDNKGTIKGVHGAKKTS